jgi:hypothetical protein
MIPDSFVLEPDGRGSYTFTFSSERGEVAMLCKRCYEPLEGSWSPNASAGSELSRSAVPSIRAGE